MVTLLLIACSFAPNAELVPTPTATEDEDVADSGEPVADSGEPVEEADLAPWALLVYMDGDNDLETYVTHDLNELEAGQGSADIRVIVQADRAEGYETDDGDWTGARRYVITGDDDDSVVSSTVVQDLGEVDMADPDTLSDFLLWAHANYPAERVVLALWNHGSGWYLTDGDEATPPPGVAWDDSSGDELSIAEGELQRGLDAFVAARGPIDVIAFDACNMAAFEVGHALRAHGETLVASEHTVGGEGLQYNLAIASLSANPALSTADVADLLAYDAVEAGGEATFSAVDLTAMDALAVQVDAVAGAALEDTEVFEALLLARAHTRSAEPSWKNSYLDLVDLSANAIDSEHAALAAAGDGLASAAQGAVISTYGGGPYTWAGGLTIYFDTWDLDIYADPAASWANATRWDELLLVLADE